MSEQAAPEGKLSVTDSRTGRSYELPIVDGAIRALDLHQIKTGDDDFGLLAYDPAFQNTASCRSKITFIDGDRGILRYRGYPIEELAVSRSFLDVAYLLLHGELPNLEEQQAWSAEVTNHTFIHESIKKFIDGFHYDACLLYTSSTPMSRMTSISPSRTAAGSRKAGMLVRIRPPGASCFSNIVTW